MQTKKSQVQVQVLLEATQAIQSDNFKKVEALLIATDPLPNEMTVSKILERAAYYEKWTLVLNLCQMTGDNKPNQIAIDYVLGEIIGSPRSVRLTNLKFICEQSVTKPSKVAIESNLLKAILVNKGKNDNKWDAVEYLCLLSNNKPEQFAVDKALRGAAAAEQWDLVEKIGMMNGDNKPSQDAIDAAFKETLNPRNFSKLQMFCNRLSNKPSQKVIEATLEVLLSQTNKDWEIIKYLCFSSDIKPRKPAIDQVLQKAAYFSQWDLVEEICQMNGDNKPSQDVIDKAFRETLNPINFTKIQMFCKLSSNKPSKKVIKSTLEVLLSQTNKDWKIIEYLCLSLSSDIKPKKSVVDEVLKKAAYFSQWNLVEKICLMNGDNKPNQDAIDKAFRETLDPINFTKIQMFCKLPSNKPSEKAIEFALEVLLGNPKKDWEIIKYLCLSSEIKPGKSVIDKVLKTAAFLCQWDLVKEIGLMEGDNKPSQTAINFALKEAFNPTIDLTAIKMICELPIKPSTEAIEDSLARSYSDNHIHCDTVKYLCLLSSDNKPSQPAVDKALEKAVCFRKWDLVKVLYQMENLNNQPSQSALECVLSEAAMYNQLTIVKDLCTLPIHRRPRMASIVEAFVNAATKGHLDIVKYFLEDIEEKLPSDALNDAFVNAARFNKLEVVRYFCQTNWPDQQSIGHALVYAASNDNIETIKYLFTLDNLIKPTQGYIKQAFIAASVGSLRSLKYFIEHAEVLGLDEETFDKALLAAVNGSYGLNTIECLITLVSMTGLENALARAQAQGRTKIGNYLSKSLPKPVQISSLTNGGSGQEEETGVEYGASDSESSYESSSESGSSSSSESESSSSSASEKSETNTETEVIINETEALIKKSQVAIKEAEALIKEVEAASTCCSDISMLVLGGFMAAVGGLAVALALTLLAGTTFGVGVAVAGVVTAMVGLGFFGKGINKSCDNVFCLEESDNVLVF